MDERKLYIKNLPWSISTESLKNLFSGFGEIVSAEVILDKKSGKSKGFGFVSFLKEEEARKAISELNGKPMEGRVIEIRIAIPKR